LFEAKKVIFLGARASDGCCFSSAQQGLDQAPCEVNEVPLGMWAEVYCSTVLCTFAKPR